MQLELYQYACIYAVFALLFFLYLFSEWTDLHISYFDDDPFISKPRQEVAKDFLKITLWSLFWFLAVFFILVVRMKPLFTAKFWFRRVGFRRK